MKDNRIWRKYNEDRYLTSLEVELLVGNRFFYCSSVPRNRTKELIALWKERIMEMQDGESASIVIELSGMADETMSVATLEGLKAIKQEGKIICDSIFVLDPFLNDNEDWLRVFSDSELSEFSCICGVREHLAEYNLLEFIKLPIYTGSL